MTYADKLAIEERQRRARLLLDRFIREGYDLEVTDTQLCGTIRIWKNGRLDTARITVSFSNDALNPLTL